MALVAGSGISVHFHERTVLDTVGISVGNGEIVTIIGPNGAGKSTLLRVLLGLTRPDSGRVERRPGVRIGYVPQRLSIDPVLPLTVARFLTLGTRAPRDRLRAVLTEVGAVGVLDSPVQAISGGELQRVSLARALLRDPDLLMLDEPVQGVDVTGQSELYALIRRIRDERGCGILMVSHDLHLVMAATDHVVCLDRHVCCAGHPRAVTADPIYRTLFPHAPQELALYTHDHHDCTVHTGEESHG